jgi:hypothetical protein
VNLVFKVSDELDRVACQGKAKEWSTTSIYEVDDAEKIHNHFLHTRLEFEEMEGSNFSKLTSSLTDPEYDISDKKRVGLSLNPFYTLQHVEKFDVFVFKDYVEDNPVTRGALSMLEDLKNQGKTSSRFVAFSTLIRCVDTLHIFWD